MQRFIKSFQYALKGIWIGAGQQNFRIQILAGLLAIALAFYFRVTPTEWCILLLCIGFVLGLELMNTAIEHLVDLVTLERKPLAGKIKDVAAGAVLIVSIVSVIIAVIIFSNYMDRFIE